MKRKPKHKTERRTREIPETYCAQPECEFFGKPAQQGVCHTAESLVADLDKIEKLERENHDELIEIRKKYKGKHYVHWLEAMYENAMINWTFQMDDLIRLRKENALLRLKAKP